MPALIDAVKQIFIDRRSFLNRFVCPFPDGVKRISVFGYDADAIGFCRNAVLYFDPANPPSLRENEPECQKISIIRFSQV